MTARLDGLQDQIRLEGNCIAGAYITDIIKDFEEKASGKMMEYLRKDRDFERRNVEQFRAELRGLGVDQPTLIAFGQDAFKILTRNLGEHYDIWNVPHYSNYTSKEIYREASRSRYQIQSDIRPSVKSWMGTHGAASAPQDPELGIKRNAHASLISLRAKPNESS